LGTNPGSTFDLIIFYRGLHCPLYAKYPMELERPVPEFEKPWGQSRCGQRGYSWLRSGHSRED